MLDFLRIYSHHVYFEQERQTFPNELDNLEKQIKQQKLHFEELQATDRDAQIARDSAKVNKVFSIHPMSLLVLTQTYYLSLFSRNYRN